MDVSRFGTWQVCDKFGSIWVHKEVTCEIRDGKLLVRGRVPESDIVVTEAAYAPDGWVWFRLEEADKARPDATYYDPNVKR